MAQKERSVKGRIFAVLGIVLVLTALAMTVWNFASAEKAADEAAKIADRLCAMMPEITQGGTDGGEDPAMPQAELDGESFVGVIEVPLYKCKLPIYSSWDADKTASYPCRFTGSVYEKSLAVGGADAVGQFDFMESITVGDTVVVTDMTGGRFEYTVYEIEVSDTAEAEKLTADAASLTFFARDTYSLEYIIVRCK